MYIYIYNYICTAHFTSNLSHKSKEIDLQLKILVNFIYVCKICIYMLLNNLIE